MSMKLSIKFVIGVITLPKYFASHFAHVTLNLTFISFVKKWRTFILKKNKAFGVNTFSTTVPTECRLLVWYSVFTF